jgi:ABC-2 type transport system ATP-binding protein
VSGATIVIEGLSKSYGRRAAIQGLSLQIVPGELYGFLGPNGAGKTTAIRVILGLLKPTGGVARVLGLDAWRNSHRIKADVGYVPGDLRLYPWMTARNALRLVGRVRGRPLLGAGLALAERFQLAPDLAVHRMSRGMRQKLGLILCLAHGPKVLVLDEPTTALDPPMQGALYEVLRERARGGATVFFSSHTLSEVETLCTRVAILREGRLVAEETLAGLRERARRTVLVTWTDAAHAEAATVPACLALEAREGGRWRCSLRGEAMDVVQWARNQPLSDLTISPPDLETVFARFYQGDGA